MLGGRLREGDAGPTMRCIVSRSIPLLAVVLVSACGDRWDLRDCTADEQRFIDAGIDRAVAVEASVAEILAQRCGEDLLPFKEVIDELVEVRDRDRIRCGVPASESAKYELAGAAELVAGTITLNIEGKYWSEALDSWLDSEYVGDHDEEEIADMVAASSLEEFWELEAAAYHYYYGPARVASILTHEAAHLATGEGHPGEDLEIFLDDTMTDYTIEVGNATRTAIYWEVWVPERTELGELFEATHE